MSPAGRLRPRENGAYPLLLGVRLAYWIRPDQARIDPFPLRPPWGNNGRSPLPHITDDNVLYQVQVDHFLFHGNESDTHTPAPASNRS